MKDAGRPAEAVAVYRRAVTRIRDAVYTTWPSPRAARQPAGSPEGRQAALALNGRSPEALNGLGLLRRVGREADAAAAFEQATALDPSNAAYWTNLGNARRASGISDGPRTHTGAHSGRRDLRRCANGLGAILVQTGKPADAVQWFERAIQQAPDFYEARLNLGIALQESGQRARADQVYREIACQGTGSLQTRETPRHNCSRKKIDRRRCSVSCHVWRNVRPGGRSVRPNGGLFSCLPPVVS